MTGTRGRATEATSTPTPPVEVELKYRVGALEAGERYLAVDELGGFRPTGPLRTERVEDRYVETTDGRLSAAGYAARLRITAAGTTISLKATGRGDGGLHRRVELEGPASGTNPVSGWPASDARALVLDLVGDERLVEVVTIRQLRRKRDLHREDGDDGPAVELSLDEAEVVAGGQVVDRFVELEVELVRGDEAALSPIATVLEADPALAPAVVSKLEAALAAIGRGSGVVHGRRALAEAVAESPEGHAHAADGRAPAEQARRPARTPGVLADDHVAEAGRKILRFHLARMLAREEGTRLGADPEELHAMRVATRRMRAAWRVFGDAFRPSRTRRYGRPLRRIARRLGAVRDLDVLISNAEGYQAHLAADEQPGLEPLLAAWRARRDRARRRLLGELDSNRYRSYVAAFQAFAETEGEGVRRAGPAEPHRVRDTSPSRAWAALERVRGYELVLDSADVATLHELRIAAKWLRYTLEFVRDPLGPDVGALVPRVVALQDHLGLLHDADVAAGLARHFLVDEGSRLSAAETAAITQFAEARETEVETLRRTIGRPWRAVAGATFRRRLGRVVAEL